MYGASGAALWHVHKDRMAFFSAGLGFLKIAPFLNWGLVINSAEFVII